MDVLDSIKAMLKNPQFHRTGNRPHISVYGDRRVIPGELLTIRELSIAAKIGEPETAKRRIVAAIYLAGQPTA